MDTCEQKANPLGKKMRIIKKYQVWETGETVGDVGRVSQRSAHRRFVWSSMEVSSVYITPKRKSRNLATSSSSEESSPEGKKLRHSYSPDSKNSDDEDQVMAALNLTEGVTKKLDLILERLSKLDSKMEELNKTVKGLQGKVSSLEIDVVSTLWRVVASVCT